ncbi:hypothetical protein [Flammeovirga pacifica]|uniref:Beta-lactamase-inhibitor-like PepSY-like domain-containing protein n=1 Tax=Flammeovirga pacifica TaxID=915059 RepID=A0A1S1Z0K8_FLAPC|nr:hypothetical protein [Flammeovirga pacifica]OHX66777.1 hypothetical protein NH26_10620 [Flammeovirga pacifica]
MKKFHLLFAGLILFFSLLFSNLVLADNIKPIEDKKNVIENFNEAFEVGQATYEGNVVYIEMDIKALSKVLGWAPDMFEEYCKTNNGQETYQLFCDYVKESHGFEFEKSGFKNIQINLMKKDEIILYYNENI